MRTLVRLLALTSLWMLSTWSVAQSPSWPTKPIKLISPYAPGGTNDITARLVAKFMQERLGQPVLVENKPGANNRLATELVARAPADGYTLFWVAAPFTVNPSMYDKLPYDTIKDFTPIAHTVSLPILFSVPAASPAKTVKEFVELAARDPKQASVCSPAAGSGPHLAMELLAWSSGAPLVHVPYKGTGPALNDLLGGQVSMMFSQLSSALPHIQSGKLRALGVASLKRSSTLPDLPTVAEQGFPGFEAVSWYALMVPAGTSSEIIGRLYAETVKAMRQPDVIEKLTGLGARPVAGSPAELASLISAETARWADVIRRQGITAE